MFSTVSLTGHRPVFTVVSFFGRVVQHPISVAGRRPHHLGPGTLVGALAGEGYSPKTSENVGR